MKLTLSWWGPCYVCEDDVKRYLYRDGRCTVHSPLAEKFLRDLTAGVRLRAPAVTPRSDRGATPTIASGTLDDDWGDEA